MATFTVAVKDVMKFSDADSEFNTRVRDQLIFVDKFVYLSKHDLDILTLSQKIWTNVKGSQAVTHQLTLSDVKKVNRALTGLFQVLTLSDVNTAAGATNPKIVSQTFIFTQTIVVLWNRKMSVTDVLILTPNCSADKTRGSGCNKELTYSPQ